MKYFLTHWRVVAALLVREMSARFGNKPGGYIWALFDPAAHIFFMTIIFMAVTRTPALGTSFPLFFATGYLAFQFYAAMASYLNSAVKSNRSLLSYPNVAPIDTIVARYILQFATTTFVATFVLTAVCMTMRAPPTVYWPALAEAAFAASLLGLGLAFFNNVMFVRFPIYEQIFGIISRPLFLISGVFYLPDSLPHPFKEIVLFNPIVHVIMLFRTGFYPEYRAESLDMGYLYAIAFTLIFFGMLFFTMYPKVLRSK